VVQVEVDILRLWVRAPRMLMVSMHKARSIESTQ
jgi:hypothetical protein